ncbi:MAG: arginine--tRNA ligase [Candidatus Daviesbacteria bacterium]|nr:arginine--tRNA ligase [Candidatus Daviesbacteria bacterium]
MTEQYLGIPVPVLSESNIPITKPDLLNMPRSNQYIWTATQRDLISHLVGLNPVLAEAGMRATEPSPNVAADLTVICHEMAGRLRKSPAQIAQELAEGFNSDPNPPTIQEAIAQKGYLNFLLNMHIFGNQAISEVETYQDHYGEQNIGEGETVVIDCSSPNVAKYMSIGHLRSTIIGESLARINRAIGYKVIRDNHLGDWGTQFGMLARAHELWADDYEELSEGTDPVKGLYKLYVRIHEEVEKEKIAERERSGLDANEDVETALEREGRRWFQRLESGDERAIELLKWATQKSLAEFQRVYDVLGSRYEYMLGESFYIPMIPRVLEYMRERNIASIDETGAIVVDLSMKNLDKLVVQKTDGTSLYSTRDLATLVARCAWFNPHRIIYVVGEDQQRYFRQIFATFDMMTGNTGPQTEHVHFGMIRLPEGKMSTRAGRVIFLEDLLTEAVDRARQKIDDLSRDLSREEKETIARQVGVGAVVFFDLGQGRERSIKFDWDSALSFTGRSAPYIQYAYARMRALLQRAQKEQMELRYDLPIEVTNQPGNALIKHLSKFPEAITRAAQTSRPDILAEYIFRAADLFTTLYDRVRIVNEPDSVRRNSLLRLTQASAQVVKNGLDLLCIEAPERM